MRKMGLCSTVRCKVCRRLLEIEPLRPRKVHRAIPIAVTVGQELGSVLPDYWQKLGQDKALSIWGEVEPIG